MADSNITKKALASALKELMEETSFRKISVGDICERCEMNRKSFYYHFEDKYDLVNWIFDTEVSSLLRDRRPDDQWEIITKVCSYLYGNRSFYCKAFQIQGQNSLLDHFREFLLPLLQGRLAEMIGPGDIHQIGADFIADGIVCAIRRWLIDKNCVSPEEFVSIIRKMVEGTARSVYRELSAEE